MIETVVFPCTYRCDGRCIMCSIYERTTKDLSIEMLRKFFASPQIKNIRSLNLTGGEPTLRNDLPELMQMIYQNCKGLRELLINTNGLNPKHIKKQIEKVLAITDPEISVWVFISLDTVSKPSDYIRGVKDAASKAMKTVDSMKELQSKYPKLSIGLSCTITKANCNELNDVLCYAKEKDIYMDFMLATVNDAYIKSSSKKENFILEENQKDEVIRFLSCVNDYKKTVSSKLYIQKIIDRLKGKTSKKECILREGRGVLLEADGKIRSCGMTDEITLGDLLTDDTFDQLGQPLDKKYQVFCEKCDTDSYYTWTQEAQKQIMSEMLMNIRNRRH